jgi:hypothetical protein
VTSWTPRTGGRVVLELASADAGRVVYRAALLAAGNEWQGEVSVDAAGTVAFEAWSPAEPPPPAWLIEHARTALRTEWRGRKNENSEPWPRRISRWRGR